MGHLFTATFPLMMLMMMVKMIRMGDGDDDDDDNDVGAAVKASEAGARLWCSWDTSLQPPCPPLTTRNHGTKCCDKKKGGRGPLPSYNT